jgi:hypothetical protein
VDIIRRKPTPRQKKNGESDNADPLWDGTEGPTSAADGFAAVVPRSEVVVRTCPQAVHELGVVLAVPC